MLSWLVSCGAIIDWRIHPLVLLNSMALWASHFLLYKQKIDITSEIVAQTSDLLAERGELMPHFLIIFLCILCVSTLRIIIESTNVLLQYTWRLIVFCPFYLCEHWSPLLSNQLEKPFPPQYTKPSSFKDIGNWTIYIPPASPHSVTLRTTRGRGETIYHLLARKNIIFFATL